MKKVLALVLSLVMVFSMSIAASATSVFPPLTPDTIITNDNINQVFIYWVLTQVK